MSGVVGSDMGESGLGNREYTRFTIYDSRLTIEKTKSTAVNHRGHRGKTPPFPKERKSGGPSEQG
jgi:hypothetical protein